MPAGEQQMLQFEEKQKNPVHRLRGFQAAKSELLFRKAPKIVTTF